MTVEPTTSSRMVSAHILSAEMFMSKFNLKDVSMLAERGDTLARSQNQVVLGNKPGAACLYPANSQNKVSWPAGVENPLQGWYITINLRHCQVDDAKMNVQF